MREPSTDSNSRPIILRVQATKASPTHMSCISLIINMRWLLIVCMIHLSRGQVERIDAILNPTDCESDHFYDLSHIKCVKCPENSYKSNDGFSCVCDKFSKIRSNFGNPEKLVCERCPADHVATNDGWACIACPEGKSPDSSGLCENCPRNHITYSRSIFGIVEFAQQCGQCRADTRPSRESGRCESCNPGIHGQGCQCSSGALQLGGVCIPSQDVVTDSSEVNSISYETNAGRKTVSSWIFREHLRAADALCKLHQNLTACQFVANLCVLQQYSRSAGQSTQNDACGLFIQMVRADTGVEIDWPNYLPWLYYSDDARSVLDAAEITTVFSMHPDDPSSKLHILLATYALDGSFLGFRDARQGALQLCKNQPWILESAFEFGRKILQKCQLSVSDLLRYRDVEFYDPYILFSAGGTESLFPVPSRVLNFKLDNEEVNKKTDEGDDRRWRLTRRLFSVDTWSGRTSVNSTPEVIQYAKSIQLYITKQIPSGTDGKIYPPLIVVEYGAHSITDPSDDTPDIEVSFSVHYYMDTVRREKSLEITMGCICSLGALWAGIHTWSWTRRSGRAAIDFLTILKFVLSLMETLSNIFLFAMMTLSLWLLVFYKKQRTVILMYPTEEQEYSFLIYVGLATCFKTITVVLLLIEQVTARIFMVDWERPRGHIIPLHGESDEGVSLVNPANRPPSPITIWRSYLVANEWNELQTMRKTSLNVRLFLMLLFLKVLHFESLALIEPGARLLLAPAEFLDTRMSRFAVASALFLLIGFVQWFVGVIILERCIYDQFHQFGDLCSIANISVFALQYNNFGYYIHGRSVHGMADTNMKEINENLQRERENLCSTRGLEPDSDQQSFVMCLPVKFRYYLDRILSPVVSPNLPANRMSQADPITVKMGNVISVHQQMNRFLISFLENSVHDSRYVVKDRLFMEAVLGMEFQDTTETGIFFNDKSDQAFTNCLFYGHEFTLLTFELLLFCSVDIVLHDFIWSAVICFVVSWIISIFRQVGGRKNLARTSLVDERFLI